MFATFVFLWFDLLCGGGGWGFLFHVTDLSAMSCLFYAIGVYLLIVFIAILYHSTTESN